MSASDDDGENVPSSAEIIPLRPTRPCAICKRPSIRAFHPFCSKRCADLDLSRWLDGSYAIPVVEEPQGIDSGQLSDDDDEHDY